ncbi:RNA-directed DNA polymerase from mobile element jockey [Trichonephila clavipes]|nr:RNA-directed DNA polymerase from mobile element jockey [Trichonephila clavipes]
MPRLQGPSGMAYSDFEKVEAFKDTLEVTFQENAEPYSDDHPTVSTCLFADDSVALTQGVHLNYTIKAMQNYIVILQNWLTDWRIAIKVEKTQAIVFRKWGVIDPQTELTLFEDNIHWVPVVRYLGLHIDSRLIYKKHIEYLSDKFWGRIALAISLIGRSSPLSLENKLILYKQILHPTITYGSPVWGAAAQTHTKRIQVIQNKILRIIANAPWYVRNSVIHHDLHMEPIDNYITRTPLEIFLLQSKIMTIQLLEHKHSSRILMLN